MWPGVALGAFLANAWTGVPLVTVLGITCGNTLEAVVGACLLRRVAGFMPSLERVRDVLALVALAAVGSTLIAATIGVGSLVVGGEVPVDDFGSVWRVWWLGDMGGDLLVAPLILAAAAHWPFDRVPGRASEAIVLAAAVVGLSVFVFRQETNLAYLVFPLLVWAALRFWQPGAAAASLAVATIAVYYTANEDGPFVRSNPDDSLLLAQTYFGVTGVTVLLLAAVITERRRAEETVEQIAEALQESLLPSRLPEIPGIDLAARFHRSGRAIGWAVTSMTCSSPATAGGRSSSATCAGRVRRQRRSRSRALYVADRGFARGQPEQAVGRSERRALPRPHRASSAASPMLAWTGSTAGSSQELSIGGHPLPLLLRPDGIVTGIGTYGVVLAPRRTHSSRHDLELHPGDCVLLYTDGLTDAYAPGRRSSPGRRVAAGVVCRLRAGDIADHVYGAVLDLSARSRATTSLWWCCGSAVNVCLATLDRTTRQVGAADIVRVVTTAAGRSTPLLKLRETPDKRSANSQRPQGRRLGRSARSRCACRRR